MFVMLVLALVTESDLEGNARGDFDGLSKGEGGPLRPVVRLARGEQPIR